MNTTWRSWLEVGGDRFASGVKAIIESCAASINACDLGDEDTQCQHLFTSMFTALRSEQPRLNRLLIEDTEIRDLMVEVRYYRSRRRRNHRDKRIQFVERETGADFALSLMVDLRDLARAQRHVLAQAKLIENDNIRVNTDQLDLLDESAGGELGLYALWGEHDSPIVVTVANLKAVIRASSNGLRAGAVKRFGRGLSDYVVDDFLGLWHGADFYSNDYGESPPKESPPVLYHLLHGGVPPANVAHFGIYNASRFVGLRSGFYVQGMDIPERTPIP